LVISTTQDYSKYSWRGKHRPLEQADVQQADQVVLALRRRCWLWDRGLRRGWLRFGVSWRGGGTGGSRRSRRSRRASRASAGIRATLSIRTAVARIGLLGGGGGGWVIRDTSEGDDLVGETPVGVRERTDVRAQQGDLSLGSLEGLLHILEALVVLSGVAADPDEEPEHA
jgi:hypothetical protein